MQPEFVSRYLCGEGDYDKVAPWPEHQAHYEEHQ